MRTAFFFHSECQRGVLYHRKVKVNSALIWLQFGSYQCPVTVLKTSDHTVFQQTRFWCGRSTLTFKSNVSSDPKSNTLLLHVIERFLFLVTRQACIFFWLVFVFLATKNILAIFSYLLPNTETVWKREV